ncbi:Putative nuclease HARBI1-like Protein [Tribolium castaneum]|uniref:Nuclease HARBI1-like Protein n=1 Tax=Tribolium castaneum TaxID=7070 RepID=D7EKH7_TRICA|nr:Putative nuclease HARBI1-like Protein [Tribolium castaneum]
MGLTSIHNIIYNTCKTIWAVLAAPIYLNKITESKWKVNAKDFFTLWNFSNCIGALDGKHITVQAPPNSGSLFYNYKNSFNIVLLAACDANYIFTLIDIGAYGSQSDGGIFKESIFGRAMESNNLNIPPDDYIPATNVKIPYAVVADEAFPLKKFIMRPYPGRQLTHKKRIFNYRLSRARRVIENAFGILTARWRILKHNINAHPKNVDVMVQAIVVLHNFCKTHSSNAQYCPPGYTDVGDQDNGGWRIDLNNEPLPSVGRLSANIASRQNYDIRDAMADYFVSLPWQIDCVFRGKKILLTGLNFE